MSRLLFDPNGGELGFSIGRNTPAENIIQIIHIVANIFRYIVDEDIKPVGRELYYSIKINTEDRDIVEAVLNYIKLPEKIYIYKSDDRHLFEMRGPSGGVVTSMVFYIVTRT